MLKKIVLSSLTAAAMLLLVSCDENKDPHGFYRLSGTWTTTAGEGQWLEHWDIAGDGTILLTGYSGELMNGDTTVFEELQIEKNGEDNIYSAKVFGQNDGKPIQFKMITRDHQTLRFENPLHDFPQFIDYYFMDNQKIYVTIGRLDDPKDNMSMTFHKKMEEPN